MINTGSLLDSALGRQHDESSELRAKALVWLNESIQMLAVYKNWEWLKSDTTLTISGNAASLPSDFNGVHFISGDNWYLKGSHQYTNEEAEWNTDGDSVPYGYTLSSSEITFLPAASDGDADLIYYVDVPEYSDGDETILPNMFAPLLTRAVMSAVYEYEENGRAMPSIQLGQEALRGLAAKDNRLKPKPKHSKYMRGRL